MTKCLAISNRSANRDPGSARASRVLANASRDRDPSGDDHLF